MRDQTPSFDWSGETVSDWLMDGSLEADWSVETVSDRLIGQSLASGWSVVGGHTEKKNGYRQKIKRERTLNNMHGTPFLFFLFVVVFT